MKKTYFLISLTLFGLTNQIYSQSFSFVRTSPPIVYNSADSTLHSYATITNNTNSNITIHIVLSNIVQPQSWDTLAFCTWVLCYGPGTYVVDEVAPPGVQTEFYVYANPFGIQGSASCRITMSHGSTTVSQDFGFQTVPIGIIQISSVAKDFSLEQNYPNPFNPATKINFSIPKISFSKLVVYDILGREVETLVQEQLKPGEYEVDWDASKYSSGMYFYKLITEHYTNIKKMVLVK